MTQPNTVEENVQLLVEQMGTITPALNKLDATVGVLGEKVHRGNNLLQVWSGELLELNRELGDFNKRLELIHGRIGQMLDRMADALNQEDQGT